MMMMMFTTLWYREVLEFPSQKILVLVILCKCFLYENNLLWYAWLWWWWCLLYTDWSLKAHFFSSLVYDLVRLMRPDYDDENDDGNRHRMVSVFVLVFMAIFFVLVSNLAKKRVIWNVNVVFYLSSLINVSVDYIWMLYICIWYI